MPEADIPQLKIEEVVELKKFDHDPGEVLTAEDLEKMEPSEILGIKNGEIISHRVREGNKYVEKIPKGPKASEGS